MFGMLASLTSLALLVLTASAYEKVCRVSPLGGGQDDGPTINSVFSECASEATIVLDGYYSVNTLLLTEGLNHVDILLSGTGEHFVLPVHVEVI